MITVAGNIKADVTVESRQFPAPGAPILEKLNRPSAGGKGADWLMAAAHLGCHIHLLICVASDLHERTAVSLLTDEAVKNQPCDLASCPLKRHLMSLARTGENSIMIALESNTDLQSDHVAVDTTLAGDVPSGVSATAAGLGLPLMNVAPSVNAAGSLATLVRDTTTAPSTEELEQFLDQTKGVSR